MQTVDVGLEAQPITLGEVVVEAPSRAPERVVEAPAAVAAVDPALACAISVTGQVPLALATMPGVGVVQSGVPQDVPPGGRDRFLTTLKPPEVGHPAIREVGCVP